VGGTTPTITGALTTVADAPAKAVLTSIIAALVAISIPLTHYLIPDVGARVTERIAGLVLLDYVVWRQIVPSFVQVDALSSAGVVLLLLYGTALGLRRLMPTT
jgi:hypothetical protein